MSRPWIGAIAATAAILTVSAPAAALAQDEGSSPTKICNLYLMVAKQRLVILGTAAQNVVTLAEPGPEAWKARFDAEYDLITSMLREYRRCINEWGPPQQQPGPGTGVTITESGAAPPPSAAVPPPPPPVIMEPPPPPIWYRPPVAEPPRTAGDWRQRLRPRGERPRDRRKGGKGGGKGGTNCHTNPVTGKLDCGEG